MSHSSEPTREPKKRTYPSRPRTPRGDDAAGYSQELARYLRGRTVLSMGDMAAVCRVAPRTVAGWFDSGRLRGYRIPGSADRRVPIAEAIRFIKSHGMPLNELAGLQTRTVLLLTPLDYHAPGWDVLRAGTATQAAALLIASSLDALVIDQTLAASPERKALTALARDRNARVVSILLACEDTSAEDADAFRASEGHAAVLHLPLCPDTLAQTLTRLDDEARG